MSATTRTSSLPDLGRAEWLAWPGTRAVFAALRGDGVEIRAVGGAVRNTLMGRPVGEVDLATTANPETVMELAGAAGLKVVPTGVEHGTVTIVAGDKPFEVTTLRKDVETYGRRAKVAFTDDWTADARRRDFTINALYAGADGTLFDPLGGLADIEAGRVRFIGEAEERIREDFLRILRFFRFNAEFGAPPYDPDGLLACVRQRAGLAALSPERVRAELMQLLAAGGVMDALEAMFDYGLLPDVLGGVPRLAQLARLVAVEAETGAEPGAILRLAALALEVEEDAGRLADRFRLSNAECARLEAAAGHRAIARAMSDSDARAALYRAGPQDYRVMVLFAWAASGDAVEDEEWRRRYELPDRGSIPAFPLKGADIVALGVPKGPRVGRILRELEARWIAADFEPGRETLLGMARMLAGEDAPGGTDAP